MPVTNAKQFSKEVLAFSRSVPVKLLVPFQKKIAMQILDGVVKMTPVDTGRARGNWQVSINSVDVGTLEIKDKEGNETIVKGVMAMAGLKPYQVIYITNNLPYIEALENGHSQQAPSGMLSITMQRVEAQIK